MLRRYTKVAEPRIGTAFSFPCSSSVLSPSEIRPLSVTSNNQQQGQAHFTNLPCRSYAHNCDDGTTQRSPKLSNYYTVAYYLE